MRQISLPYIVKEAGVSARVVFLATIGIMTLLYIAGCVYASTDTDDPVYRKTGKALETEYKAGDKFSSGTIDWNVLDGFQIKSTDGKFAVTGSEKHHKLSKQFLYAIPQALEFIKENAPHYYDMMRQVNTNIIRFDLTLERRSTELSDYKDGETIIGDLEIGPRSYLYVLSSLLIPQVAIHGNEQIVRKEGAMNEYDSDCEARLHHLKFFKDIGISEENDPARLTEHVSRHLRGAGTDYFKYIKDLDSTNIPELTKLQLDLGKYLSTQDVKHLPIDGLIKHFYDYAADKYNLD